MLHAPHAWHAASLFLTVAAAWMTAATPSAAESKRPEYTEPATMEQLAHNFPQHKMYGSYIIAFGVNNSVVVAVADRDLYIGMLLVIGSKGMKETAHQSICSKLRDMMPFPSKVRSEELNMPSRPASVMFVTDVLQDNASASRSWLGSLPLECVATTICNKGGRILTADDGYLTVEFNHADFSRLRTTLPLFIPENVMSFDSFPNRNIKKDENRLKQVAESYGLRNWSAVEDKDQKSVRRVYGFNSLVIEGDVECTVSRKPRRTTSQGDEASDEDTRHAVKRHRRASTERKRYKCFGGASGRAIRFGAAESLRDRNEGVQKPNHDEIAKLINDIPEFLQLTEQPEQAPDNKKDPGEPHDCQGAPAPATTPTPEQTGTPAPLTPERARELYLQKLRHLKPSPQQPQ